MAENSNYEDWKKRRYNFDQIANGPGSFVESSPVKYSAIEPTPPYRLHFEGPMTELRDAASRWTLSPVGRPWRQSTGGSKSQEAGDRSVS